MRHAITFGCLLLLACTSSHAAMDLGDGRTIAFASVAEGAAMLGKSDDFVVRMSPFDRAARLKSVEAVSQEKYLAFVAKNVLAWEKKDEGVFQSAFDSMRERLARYSHGLPSTVYLVKTTGREEGDAAYTRGNVIVFPQRMLGSSREELAETLSHELFHVLSRHNPEWRERLYAAIGFEACPEVALPDELAPRRITNPDAPKNNHRIRLTLDKDPVWAVPVLYSDSAVYDAKRGGEFFNYMQFKMLLLDDHAPARLVALDRLSGFNEQVGKNTDYVIHPEEILAVNFSFLVLDRKGLPSPEIPERMRKLLENP